MACIYLNEYQRFQPIFQLLIGTGFYLIFFLTWCTRNSLMKRKKRDVSFVVVLFVFSDRSPADIRHSCLLRDPATMREPNYFWYIYKELWGTTTSSRLAALSQREIMGGGLSSSIFDPSMMTSQKDIEWEIVNAHPPYRTVWGSFDGLFMHENRGRNKNNKNSIHMSLRTFLVWCVNYFVCITTSWVVTF